MGRLSNQVMLAALMAATVVGLGQSSTGPRVQEDVSSGWRFFRGDSPGAEEPGFQDSSWALVTVPHDWAIAQPFDEQSSVGGAGAFLDGGVSWYRHKLSLPVNDRGRDVFVEFDGVMANSQVWLNGHLLGSRPNGYVSFGYELTPWVRWGGENVLVVRTDTSRQPASRWYEGAGIYRKVRLVIQSPIHLEHWGVTVATPQVSAEKAMVVVTANVTDQSELPAEVRVRVRLVNPAGETISTAESATLTVRPRGSAKASITQVVLRPDRWDVGHGALYRAVVDVEQQGSLVDEEAVPFGIREFHFDATTGFWINGRNIKILGACLHEDAGAFGIAVPSSVYRIRLQALQAMGVNAIRTAHGPPSPEFLAQTDQLGLLVMDEMFDMWSEGKNPYDYHLDFASWHVQDVRDTARRDRNHPSIVLWSAGNEIRDTANVQLASTELASILQVFHDEDPTRPVTQALFRPNVSHDYDDGLADMLDVVGQNYRTKELIAAHEQKPTRKVVGTENTHDLDQWLALRDHAFFSGEFIWSGADYLGEARYWPGISRSTGLLDRTDEPHMRGLQRSSWWSKQLVVYVIRRERPTPKAPTDPGYEKQQMGETETVFHDWTPEEAGSHDEHVEVYSNCKSVDVQLNGRSLGRQAIHPDDSPRLWTVAYAAGQLTAICDDEPASKDILRTAGAAHGIRLVSAGGQLGSGFDDIVQVRAVVIDAKGVRVPRTNPRLEFSVEGPGSVVAVDNGDLTSHEAFQGSSRSAYDGQAVAYIRATKAGVRILVKVAAEGLEPGRLELSPP